MYLPTIFVYASILLIVSAWFYVRDDKWDEVTYVTLAASYCSMVALCIQNDTDCMRHLLTWMFYLGTLYAVFKCEENKEIGLATLFSVAATLTLDAVVIVNHPS